MKTQINLAKLEAEVKNEKCSKNSLFVEIQFFKKKKKKKKVVKNY
jgi:hypothetical protein